MEFPRLVFTSPGPNKCGGGTYGHELVRDEKELKAALEVGFFETIPEALDSLKTKDFSKPKAEEKKAEVSPKETKEPEPPKKAEPKAKAEK